MLNLVHLAPLSA